MDSFQKGRHGNRQSQILYLTVNFTPNAHIYNIIVYNIGGSYRTESPVLFLLLCKIYNIVSRETCNTFKIFE